jgi:hypothetical protein
VSRNRFSDLINAFGFGAGIDRVIFGPPGIHLNIYANVIVILNTSELRSIVIGFISLISPC